MKQISRRTLLGQANLLGSTHMIGLPLAATTDAPPLHERTDPSRKLKVVVTGGHPGDPEYGCGGTIARYTDLGHEVVLLYLNDGEVPPERAPAGPGDSAYARQRKLARSSRRAPSMPAKGTAGRWLTSRITRHSGIWSRPRGRMSSSRIGPSTIMPIIAPSRCSLMMLG